MKKIIALLLCVLLIAALPSSILADSQPGPLDELIPIHEVYIKGFRPAVAGSTPEFAHPLFTDEEVFDIYSHVYSYWHDNTEGHDMFDEQSPFVISHQYSEGCMLAAGEGYYFADDCVFYINGRADYVDLVMPHQYFDGCVYVQSIAFPCYEQYVLGDIDGNGAVEGGDALLALRCALGLVELGEEQVMLGDVDFSGGLSGTDALTILRASLGLIEL
ncbi:MAG: dockerin type I repeat-containing protein [Clostridia bacterium]|nr:dockerin type I repeat-containing protein [Clostridia bacterium]